MKKNSKIYSFTNENINSFQNLYSFQGAKVLSVLGSGDQYFSSMLYGAKIVEVFDKNRLAWDFFVLKFFGIIVLRYEEFYDYFVASKLDDYHYFEKLRKYLPEDVAFRIDSLYKTYKKLSILLEYIDMASIRFNYGNFIPYMRQVDFYCLKKILIREELPKFYNIDFSKLPEKVSNTNYDILLASNCYDWMYDRNSGLNDYDDLLEKFNAREYQAIYSWWLTDEFKEEVLESNYRIDEVPTSIPLKKMPDYVITKRKK